MSYFREYVCSEPCGWDFGEDGNPRIKLWKTDEEVIRCRECRKSDPEAYDYCEFYYAHECDPNGFCAWAERRQA